jgi:hypothetical protein
MHFGVVSFPKNVRLHKKAVKMGVYLMPNLVNAYNVVKDIEVNCVQSAIGSKINANKARRLTQKLANAQLIAQLVAYSARSVQRVTME